MRPHKKKLMTVRDLFSEKIILTKMVKKNRNGVYFLSFFSASFLTPKNCVTQYFKNKQVFFMTPKNCDNQACHLPNPPTSDFCESQ